MPRYCDFRGPPPPLFPQFPQKGTGPSVFSHLTVLVLIWRAPTGTDLPKCCFYSCSFNYKRPRQDHGAHLTSHFVYGHALTLCVVSLIGYSDFLTCQLIASDSHILMLATYSYCTLHHSDEHGCCTKLVAVGSHSMHCFSVVSAVTYSSLTSSQAKC